MRLDYFLTIGVTLVAISTLIIFNSQPHENSDDVTIEAFKLFKQKNGILYNSFAEEGYRMSIFIENFNEIQSHNSNSKNTYQKGVNRFSDLTLEEFKAKYLMKIPPPSTKNLPVGNLKITNAPSSVNWVTQKVLPEVKDQSACGSCWAFSTVGMLEAIYNMSNKGKDFRSFSEQQLVDCCGAQGFGCQGCSGAWPTDAVKYVQQNGIVQEEQYPYNAQDNQCQTDKQNVGYKPGQQFQVKSGDNNLRVAVAQQPISICVDASYWSPYSSGIFNQCSDNPNDADHAVLLVGYDTANNWIVRNSWSTSWGEQGYIRLSPGNTCGLQNYAIYANYQ